MTSTQPTNEPRMKRYGGTQLYIGTVNGKTVNAFRRGKAWIARANGVDGSIILCAAKTRRAAIARVVDDFWF